MWSGKQEGFEENCHQRAVIHPKDKQNWGSYSASAVTRIYIVVALLNVCILPVILKWDFGVQCQDYSLDQPPNIDLQIIKISDYIVL